MMSIYNTQLKKKKKKNPTAHWNIGKYTRIVGGSGTLAKAF